MRGLYLEDEVEWQNDISRYLEPHSLVIIDSAEKFLEKMRKDIDIKKGIITDSNETYDFCLVDFYLHDPVIDGMFALERAWEAYKRNDYRPPPFFSISTADYTSLMKFADGRGIQEKVERIFNKGKVKENPEGFKQTLENDVRRYSFRRRCGNGQ